VRPPQPSGGWPIEAPILLLALVLAVLYGAEYGYLLSAAQAAQAERTGKSADRRQAEAETLEDRSRNRRDRKRDRNSQARNRGLQARDRATARREGQALVDVLRSCGIEIDDN
jgi:hypothetical protein